MVNTRIFVSQISDYIQTLMWKGMDMFRELSLFNENLIPGRLYGLLIRAAFFSTFLMTRPTLFFGSDKQKKNYLRPTLIFWPNNGLYGQIRYKHMTPTTIVIFTWTIPILQVFTSVQMYTICVSEPFIHTAKLHNLIWLQNGAVQRIFSS